MSSLEPEFNPLRLNEPVTVKLLAYYWIQVAEWISQLEMDHVPHGVNLLCTEISKMVMTDGYLTAREFAQSERPKHIQFGPFQIPIPEAPE